MAANPELDGYDPVAAGEQDERGTDLVWLRYNLALNPRQRLEQAEAGARAVEFLRSAKRVAKPDQAR